MLLNLNFFKCEKKEETLTEKMKRSVDERHKQTHTWKLSWNALTIADVFLDQKRVNVCEHKVKRHHMRVLEKLKFVLYKE